MCVERGLHLMIVVKKNTQNDNQMQSYLQNQ